MYTVITDHDLHGYKVTKLKNWFIFYFNVVSDNNEKIKKHIARGIP